MPIYEQLCGELLVDPVRICREVDEWLIRWHLAHQKGRP